MVPRYPPLQPFPFPRLLELDRYLLEMAPPFPWHPRRASPPPFLVFYQGLAVSHNAPFLCLGWPPRLRLMFPTHVPVSRDPPGLPSPSLAPFSHSAFVRFLFDARNAFHFSPPLSLMGRASFSLIRLAMGRFGPRLPLSFSFRPRPRAS